MNIDSTTDSDIIARSRHDSEAFAALFERHARVVGSFAAQRVGSLIAEDIVAETFLVAFRRRADYDLDHANARPWLLGIAVNIIKRHRGTEARHWRELHRSAAVATPIAPNDFDEVDRRADAARTARELLPRIRRLRAHDRDTLLLYATGELSYDEIARALGVPVGTVRSRLNRVRRILSTPPSHPNPVGLTIQGEES